MIEQPKVTVILPSLNVRMYIEECIDSVLSQTLKDIEVICVDAGSTDGTLEVLRAYEARDSRLRVIESPKKSYGLQMNLGIDAARGKYIGIVETDDWVPSEMYQELYDLCEQNELDFAKADFYRFTENEDGSLDKTLYRVSKSGKMYNEVISPSEQVECFKFVMNTWSGVYRTSFLRDNNIRHNETPGASYQDNGFWFQTLIRGNRAMFVDKPYYMNRRDNPNSSVFSSGKVYAMRDEYDYIRGIIASDMEHLARFIPLCTYYRFCGYFYNTINRIAPELRPEFLEYFSNEFRALADANEIDPTLFTPAQLRALYQVMYYPEQYLATSMQKAFPYRVRESYLDFEPLDQDGPLVSVVVPVYNVERYLAECLNTILAQTMKDFEVLCVNDGSTDSSGEVLREFAAKDSRVRVVEKENGGLSSARNFGLSRARGRYVLFVDSDDGLALNALEILTATAERKNADVVVFGLDAHYYPAVGEIPGWIEDKNPTRNKTFPSYSPRIIFKESGAKPFAVRDFLRRSFLAKNDLWFSQGFRFGEDTIFQFELFPLASNATFIKDKLYYYRCSREGSLMANAGEQIVGKAACHIQIIAHIASVWKCSGYLNKARLRFSEWAIDFFYGQFRLCPEEAKPALANDFIPVLYSFLTEQKKAKMGPGRLERVSEIESYRHQFEFPTICKSEHAASREAPSTEKPTFSFIVPVHNAEDTLSATLDSLLGQTCAGLEVICLDDHSSDSSLRILQERAALDARLRIISYGENKTANQARKDGVAMAKGEYILFCDSDDTYALNACEELLVYTSASDAEIIHFETAVVGNGANSDDKLWIESHAIPFFGVLRGKDVFDACFRGQLYGFTLWNKMYRAELAKKAFAALKDVRLPRGQDLYAYVALAYFAESYQGIPESRFYRYQLGAGMDGTETLPLDKFKSFVRLSDTAEHIRLFLEEQGALPGYQDVSMSLRSQLVGDCVNKWFKKVSAEEKGRAYDEMVASWPSWLIAEGVARRYWDKPSLLAEWWRGSNALTRKGAEVKTVGMYFHKQSGGGVEKVMSLLTPLYVSMGYKVVVMTDVQGPGDRIALPDGVVHRPLPNNGAGSAASYIVRAKALSDAIREESIDAIVYHAWNTSLLPWDMLTAKTCGADFLVYCHGVFSYRVLLGQSYFAQMPKVMSLADGMVCLSEVDKAFWGRFNSNVHVLANPIETEKMKRGVAALSGRTVLWVGRLEPEKRPDEALRVFAEVVREVPDAQLKVLGTAPTEEAMVKLNELAETLGIADAVEFCGFTDDVVPAYLESSVFLCTSECEGYPMAVLDAFILGLPVAMYELPHLAMVKGNEAVFDAPFGDAKLLGKKVASLLLSDTERRAVGVKARGFAEDLARVDLAGAWKTVFASLGKERPGSSQSEADCIMWDTLLNHYAMGLDKLREAVRCEILDEIECADTEPAKVPTAAGSSQDNKIRSSNSYKIGRAVTWPARKVKRLLSRLGRAK